MLCNNCILQGDCKEYESALEDGRLIQNCKNYRREFEHSEFFLNPNGVNPPGKKRE